ncbi:MAG: macro domain-containing protein [Asgard group archaeon]|nr:macro domain-containing protein [Asgard group archaeon]
MIYSEVKRDLFIVDEDYYLAHCISSDYIMSAGIAVPFDRKFGLKEQFNKMNSNLLKYPTCILLGRVFNLITKEKVWHKPTYDSLTQSLIKMRKICDEKRIKKIAMPKIGCGIDKLQWSKVSEIIKELFSDSEIEILICYID